jgi:hypothetical protein
MEGYNEEETHQAKDKTPDVSAGLEGRGLGALSKNTVSVRPFDLFVTSYSLRRPILLVKETITIVYLLLNYAKLSAT